MTVPKGKRKSPQAIDPYKGFSGQTTRTALLLLTSQPGSFVSLEKFEDVGVENSDGTRFASQMKVGKSNPISNRAEPLWKTFANWVRQIGANEIDATTTRFEIYVTKNHSGSLVRRLLEGQNSISDAREVVNEAREFHWGAHPKFAKRSSVSDTLAPHLDELFGSKAGMRAFESVVRRFHLTVGKGAPIADLENHLETQMNVAPALVEKMLVHFYGWVAVEIDRQILRTGKAPVISRDVAYGEFRQYYHSLVSGGTLPDVGQSPKDAELAKLLNYPFIRQLEWIKADADTCRFAMTVFFKAATARTAWVDNDYIRKEAIDDLNMMLAQKYRDSCVALNGSELTAENFGRAVLGRCHEHRCLVEQKTPPEYFIPGCFHGLANEAAIGWHPSYKELWGNTA